METVFNRYAKIDGTGALLWVEMYGDDGCWFVNTWQSSVTKNGPGKRAKMLTSQHFTNERDACTTYALGILLVGHFAA